MRVVDPRGDYTGRRAKSVSDFKDCADDALNPVAADVRLQIQEKLAVFQEQLRVLVVRSVPGIGIDDQLRLRKVLRHDPRVDRRGP